MKPISNVKPQSALFARRYAVGLQRFLSRDSSTPLKKALDLGRQAVKLRLDTLDLAAIHEQALSRLMKAPGRSLAAQNGAIQRMGVFLPKPFFPLKKPIAQQWRHTPIWTV